MASAHFKPELIAPCGMNCGVCKAYLAFSRNVPKERGKVTHCAGCLPRVKNCFIKRGCRKLSTHQFRFCYECADMPCKNLERVERRYRERYATSLVANLKLLKKVGMKEFLEAQENRFKCPDCGDVVSVHCGQCFTCRQVVQIKPNF